MDQSEASLDQISRQELQSKINKMRAEISTYSHDQDQDVSSGYEIKNPKNHRGPKNNQFFKNAKNLKKQQDGIYVVES